MSLLLAFIAATSGIGYSRHLIDMRILTIPTSRRFISCITSWRKLEFSLYISSKVDGTVKMDIDFLPLEIDI